MLNNFDKMYDHNHNNQIDTDERMEQLWDAHLVWKHTEEKMQEEPYLSDDSMGYGDVITIVLGVIGVVLLSLIFRF